MKTINWKQSLPQLPKAKKISVNEELILLETQAWLKSVIIGLNFCPFAYKVHSHHRIFYQICVSTELNECLESLIPECERLDSNDDIATTLLIYPIAFQAFDDYLDFLAEIAFQQSFG